MEARARSRSATKTQTTNNHAPRSQRRPMSSKPNR